MKTFVCDLGFSSAKYLYKGNRFRTFSAYKTLGQETLFGDDALSSTGASYLRTPEDLVRRYPEFVQYCFEKAEVSQSERIALAVGVPYRFWEEQTALPGEGLVGTINKGLAEISNVEFVKVFPQGIGGIQHYLNCVENRQGNILAIDIGFNTVIFNLFDAGKHKLIHGDTLYKRGVSQMVVDHLKPKVAQYSPGYSFSPIEVCVLLERGIIQYGFEHVDIKPEIRTATEEYMYRVFDDIEGEIRGHVGPTATFSKVLLFGGGAHYVGEMFIEKASESLDIVVLDDPEYSNCLGFERLLEQELEGLTC